MTAHAVTGGVRGAGRSPHPVAEPAFDEAQG
jgi:hypothetical protein